MDAKPTSLLLEYPTKTDFLDVFARKGLASFSDAQLEATVEHLSKMQDYHTLTSMINIMKKSGRKPSGTLPTLITKMLNAERAV